MSQPATVPMPQPLPPAAPVSAPSGLRARWRGWWQSAFGAPGALPDADRFGRALQDMADGRWAEAYAQLAALADGGHAEATRVALVMARHGERLFGWHCPLAPQRRARWAALAWSGQHGTASAGHIAAG